jgi:hypothetical protein
MARAKKENPSAVSDEFDVAAVAPNPIPAPTFDEEPDEPEESTEVSEIEPRTSPIHVIETPEQRRLMRQKRIAKAEEEQLRRLMRQFPVVLRLVVENRNLKAQLEQLD